MACILRYFSRPILIHIQNNADVNSVYEQSLNTIFEFILKIINLLFSVSYYASNLQDKRSRFLEL